MNTYLSSAQLKDQAKDRLTGHYGLLIGAGIAISVFSFLSTLLLSMLVPISSATIPGMLINEAIGFILSVFLGVFQVGMALLYLKFATGSSAVFSDIFYGFSHHLETSLTLSLLMTAVSYLFTLAYSIPFTLFRQTGDTAYLRILPVCCVLALAVYIPVSLCLSQCFYLMLDYPSKSPSEIIGLSFRIMKGHKARLFYIELSFLPLLLLGMLSVIGILWIQPYMHMTMTGFYLDIMKPEQKN